MAETTKTVNNLEEFEAWITSGGGQSHYFRNNWTIGAYHKNGAWVFWEDYKGYNGINGLMFDTAKALALECGVVYPFEAQCLET